MYELFSKFTTSDWIQLVGVFGSLITSIIAIWISIKTLKQNNKMIEEASRPILHIYSHYADGLLYIIIKNLGQSVAYIDKIETDFFVEEDNNMVQGNPFKSLKGASIPPQSAKICPLISFKLKTRKFNFSITYHSITKKYLEKHYVDADAENPFPSNYSTIHNKCKSDEVDALKVIAHTLQDILKTKL